ncbi:hypothetical protein WJ968_29650 [Achromobacter xylosoxidans]
MGIVHGEIGDGHRVLGGAGAGNVDAQLRVGLPDGQQAGERQQQRQSVRSPERKEGASAMGGSHDQQSPVY